MNKPSWANDVVEVTPDEAWALHACGAKVYWDCQIWENLVDWDPLGNWTREEIESTYHPNELFYYLSKDGTDD